MKWASQSSYSVRGGVWEKRNEGRIRIAADTEIARLRHPDEARKDTDAEYILPLGKPRQQSHDSDRRRQHGADPDSLLRRQPRGPSDADRVRLGLTAESEEFSADERIAHAKRGKAAEVAIGTPQLGDAVKETERGDPGIVDLRTRDAPVMKQPR